VPSRALDRRSLNRAYLARQLLLDRSVMAPEDALTHLVGMQAQSPQAPYTGLWSRLVELEPEALSALVEKRRAVRIVLMRSTIHLVIADDCLELRPLVDVVSERGLSGNYGRQLAGVDPEAVAAAGRELLEGEPRTSSELEPLLAERFPGYDGHALAMLVRARVPLVQLPPRGLWRRSGRPVVAPAEVWLERPLASNPSAERMVLRYLAAFGPASVKDAQVWSGLTGLGEVFERLRPELRVFAAEDGSELFDVPDGALPERDTPAPVRFLPEYDNALLSHADRSRIAERADVKRVFTKGGLLVDGFLAGRWGVRQARRTATLEIEPFRRLGKAERDDVVSEGARLLGFLAPDARAHELGFL
jgi:Winged helix DNA-binding domain